MLAESRERPDQWPIEQLIKESRWGLQLKIDGHRRLVHVGHSAVTGYSRKGTVAAVPPAIANMLSVFDADLWLDGELVGDTLHVFDLPQSTTYGVRLGTTLQTRVDVLTQFFNQGQQILGWRRSGPLQRVPFVNGPVRKAQAVARWRRHGEEGLIAKDRGSVYQPGARSTSWVKNKFTRDADCVVGQFGIDGKQNFELLMWDPGTHNFVSVGECSRLTGDGPRVSTGDVVTVGTLWSTPGGKLYQPVKARLRDDKDPAECTTDQLATLLKGTPHR